MSTDRPPRIATTDLQAIIDGFPREVHEEPGRLMFTLAVKIIRHYLGQQWYEEHIFQDSGQTRPPGFLRMNFSRGFEGERVNARRLDLAETLFNLQHIEGFDDRAEQLRRGNIESTIAEFDLARFLHLHDVVFKFVAPIGERGKDFDFAVTYGDGREACVDAKCRLEGTEVRAETIRNSLNKARQNNLPADRPGIIFVKVPQRWIEDDSVRADMHEVVKGFLRNSRRVVSVVLYTIAVSAMPDRELVLMRHRFDERPNSFHRFDLTKTWTLFQDYKIPREWGGMHPKWMRVLSKGFLFRER
jgi:hypothetical protein